MAALIGATTAGAWSPGMADPSPVGSAAAPLVVDSKLRNDVVSFYHAVYRASDGGNGLVGWTGSLTPCLPGETTPLFKDQVRRRINWYRAMAGVPGDIVFDETLNAAAQAAALIMAKRGALSHDPASDFGTGGCWSSIGQTGASDGNLALGNFGVEAIDQYMDDGSSPEVGHRAWILHPPTTRMGTGDVPGVAGDWQTISNSLYVTDSAGEHPARSAFSAWPPEGFVPLPTVFPLWSVSYDTPSFGSPTFGGADVRMVVEADGRQVPLQITYRYTGGGLAGSPRLVWQPDWTAWGGSPPLETPIRVTVTGISAGNSGAGTSHTYTVTCINPDVITDPMNLRGSTMPPPSGAVYAFDGLTGLNPERYDVGVSKVGTGPLVEGAEANPAPRILDDTSASYSLLANAAGNATAYQGSRYFHLTIPSFDEPRQTFEVDADILPGASAMLQFHRRLAAMTAGTRLSVLVNDAAAPGWKELWGRNGGATTGWIEEKVSLQAFAGRSVRFRFQLEWTNGAAFIGTTTDRGAGIDAITLTGCEHTGRPVVTALAPTARTFSFNAATAGEALAIGSRWLIGIRPVLGGNEFSFTSPLRVEVATASPGYAQWLAERHPSLAPSGFESDADGDGILNGLEYTFGFDPSKPDGPLPGLVRKDDAWALTFDATRLAYPLPDIRWEAETSENLVTWRPLTSSGTASAPVFRLPAGAWGYARWKVFKTQ